MAYNKRRGYHGPEDRLDDVAAMSRKQLDDYLATRPVVPGLPVGVVLEASASTAEIYLGAGETRALELWQVNHLRDYRSENARGPRQARVDRVIATGDVIRMRQNEKGSWIPAQVSTVGGALVAIARMGMDDNRPLGRGEWGGTAAPGMWVDFMTDALRDTPVAEIKRPEGMVPVRVSSATGRPTQGGGVQEYVRREHRDTIPGPQPVRYAAADTAKRSASRGSSGN